MWPDKAAQYTQCTGMLLHKTITLRPGKYLYCLTYRKKLQIIKQNEKIIMFQTKEQKIKPPGGKWSGCNLFYSVQSNHHKDAHQTEKNWEFQQS